MTIVASRRVWTNRLRLRNAEPALTNFRLRGAKRTLTSGCSLNPGLSVHAPIAIGLSEPVATAAARWKASRLAAAVSASLSHCIASVVHSPHSLGSDVAAALLRHSEARRL